MKILNEFKAFAIKGNMVDMGVGIVVGGAFSQIVNSFVRDIIMPPMGFLTGNVDFSNKSIILKNATETTEAISMNYGLFINALLNFIIVAVAIFLVIKQMNKLRDEIERRKQEVEVKAEKESRTPSRDIVLLTEIRDLIKKQDNKETVTLNK